MSKKAENDLDKDYFFIIDEINRGNISKIFGELLMLIEKDYRGPEHVITLAYNGESFSVPENLYIIGMMNTSDRSIAMIDYALRRRFGFIDMEPGFDTDGFRKYQDSLKSPLFDELIARIVKLNKTIKDNLGPGFQIGHSYFCNCTGPKMCTKEWMESIVDFEIVPLLEEYWIDDQNTYEEQAESLNGVFK